MGLARSGISASRSAGGHVSSRSTISKTHTGGGAIPAAGSAYAELSETRTCQGAGGNLAKAILHLARGYDRPAANELAVREAFRACIGRVSLSPASLKPVRGR